LGSSVAATSTPGSDSRWAARKEEAVCPSGPMPGDQSIPDRSRGPPWCAGSGHALAHRPDRRMGRRTHPAHGSRRPPLSGAGWRRHRRRDDALVPTKTSTRSSRCAGRGQPLIAPFAVGPPDSTSAKRARSGREGLLTRRRSTGDVVDGSARRYGVGSRFPGPARRFERDGVATELLRSAASILSCRSRLLRGETSEERSGDHRSRHAPVDGLLGVQRPSPESPRRP